MDLGERRRILSQVAFVDHALVADDEGLYACFTIFDRPGNKRKVIGHVAVDHIAVPTSENIGALAGEDAVPVAEITFALEGLSERRIFDQAAGGLSSSSVSAGQ